MQPQYENLNQEEWRASYLVSLPSSCSISTGPGLHGGGAKGGEGGLGRRGAWWPWFPADEKLPRCLLWRRNLGLAQRPPVFYQEGKEQGTNWVNGSPSLLGAEPIQSSWGWDEEMPWAKWVHRRRKVGEPFCFLRHSNLPRVAVQLAAPKCCGGQWKEALSLGGRLRVLPRKITSSEREERYRIEIYDTCKAFCSLLNILG